MLTKLHFRMMLGWRAERAEQRLVAAARCFFFAVWICLCFFAWHEEGTDMRQKRPKGTIKTEHDVIDIKAEIPIAQLAAIGALSLALNEVEATIDRLLFAVTGLDQHLQLADRVRNPA
jgi:hypothetical protein